MSKLRINLRKYNIAELRALSRAPEYKAYRKQIRRAIPKRAIDRQWWNIRAQFGYNAISRKEFNKFYEEVRKAHRKINRIKKMPDLIDYFNPSLRITRFKSMASFKRFKKRVEAINRRDYKTVANREARERLYANIYGVWGKNEYTKAIVQEFDNMTDTEFKQFFERYKQLDKLIWGSVKSLIPYLKHIDIDVTALQSDIEEFAKYINRGEIIEDLGEFRGW